MRESKWVSTSNILSVTPSEEEGEAEKGSQPITGSVGDFNFLTSTASFVFGQIHLSIWTNAPKNLNLQTERASADSQSFVEGCSTHVTIPNVLLFRLVAFSTDFLYFCLSASFVYFQIFDITSNVGTRPALALVQRILILSGLVLQPEIAPCAGAIVKWLIIFMDRVKACRAGLYLSSTFLEILASCWFLATLVALHFTHVSEWVSER